MKKAALTIITLVALLIGSSFILAQKANAISPKAGLQDGFGGPVRTVTLTQTSVVGGAAFTGTVVLSAPAPKGGLSINLNLTLDPAGGNAASVPSSVNVPVGDRSASFPITTSSVQVNTQVRIRAAASTGIPRFATFTVQPLQVATLVIVPAAEFGPFQAQGTVTLNAPVPSNTVVTLTSSNPTVVRFGTTGSGQNSIGLQFQQNQALKTFQIAAGSVSQTTTVTVTATLQNGNTVSRAVTVRQ